MAKEHLDALMGARERLVESRRKLAVALGSQRGAHRFVAQGND